MNCQLFRGNKFDFSKQRGGNRNKSLTAPTYCQKYHAKPFLLKLLKSRSVDVPMDKYNNVASRN